jgi:antitoxin MazE
MYKQSFAQQVPWMKAVIRKWGNSPAVRLPVAVIKEANLNIDQTVTIIAARGRIVIEPSDVVEYGLDELLEGINSKNLHAEVSVGPPVGKEIF